MSSIELIAILGFAFEIAWMCLSFFWIFCDYPAGVPIDVSDMSQLLVFAGMAVGYLVLHILGKRPSFNSFSPIAIAVCFLCSVFQPLCALAMSNGIHAPLIVVCAVNFLAGLGAAHLILNWLDISSRLGDVSYSSFTGFSFLGGSILFFFAATAPANLQPMFAGIYVIATIALLIFSTRRAEGNDECAPLEAVGSPWEFTKEIEPSFFVFSMVFALNFVFLFNNGREYVLFGLLSMIPGALVVALLGVFKKHFSVTVMQRCLLAVTVLGCVMLPFTSGVLQLVFACLVSAAWAAFMSANYAFIVMKSVIVRDVPMFRQGAARLAVPAFGFALGWAISSVMTMFFGPHDYAFSVLHLIMTVLLVLVVMVFYPVGSHHPAGGGGAEKKTDAPTVSIQMDESELFDRRCEAVAKLYQLSPRETDILVFLAKGRNAAWIQEQLVISPHTVKSHIYNIYRKLDIHSQQKLMSFVEEFPIDL
ncbi:MAG: helix-turn-helix transcriptional regulator [Eggerthellaceae bacterium]|nr:helix-turn-helix transcriptional regulator [Eggerthellaceae bacterium]